MNRFICLLSILIYNFAVAGQNKGVFAPYIVEGSDTFPIYQYNIVTFTYYMSAEEKMRQNQFAKLLRDVRIVMPYAKFCSAKLVELEEKTAQMKRRDRKKFLKEEEARLKAEFEEKLKDLNVRQGKLLIKLIDRETGKSSFSLIKEYKSGVTALVWQGMARFVGMNLKDGYNKEENQHIEFALKTLGYE